MSELDFASGDILLPLVGIAAGLLSIALMLHVTGRRGEGFFQYFSYAVLLSLAVSVFLSGRSLLLDYETQGELLRQRDQLATWTIRLSSSLLVLTSVERIANYGLRRDRTGSAPYSLALVFVLFWLTTVASPAILGWQHSFSKDIFYTLLIGCAALVLSRSESDAAVAATRDSLLIFLGVSATLIPLRPALVMDSSYAAGLLHGVPRFAGLAPHAVSLGMLAQLALLCLYVQPMSSRWLNYSCWALGISCLVLAQSKTSWLSFPLSAACIYWLQGGSERVRRLGGSRWTLSSQFILLGAVLLTAMLGMAYIVGNTDLRVDALLSGQRGADFASLSGRDRIWAVALKDWARHPVFGYGNSLFDEAYRTSIRMPFASNAHNQFIDTLARSGIVGVAGLILYVLSLLVFALRYAKSSRGLSLAIFVGIAFRCVSEVPLTLAGYGPEVLPQVLLLAILAGHARSRRASVTETSQPARAHSRNRWPWPMGAEREGRTRRPTWE